MSVNKQKELREKVYQKYNGHCAYCGKKIDYKDMQIDHLRPISHYGSDDFNNLMPSCRRCNHYKRANSLKNFRHLINVLNNKLSNLYLVKVALDYGIIKLKNFDGKFYFEKLKDQDP